LLFFAVNEVTEANRSPDERGEESPGVEEVHGGGGVKLVEFGGFR
jgi:hypothetical protein